MLPLAVSAVFEFFSQAPPSHYGANVGIQPTQPFQAKGGKVSSYVELGKTSLRIIIAYSVLSPFFLF